MTEHQWTQGQWSEELETFARVRLCTIRIKCLMTVWISQSHLEYRDENETNLLIDIL